MATGAAARAAAFSAVSPLNDSRPAQSIGIPGLPRAAPSPSCRQKNVKVQCCFNPAVHGLKISPAASSKNGDRQSAFKCASSGFGHGRQHQRLTCAATDIEVASASAEDPREDSVLPDSLADSIDQSAIATREALEAGSQRVLVELLIPELESKADAGDQQRIYDLQRRFLEQLQAQLGITTGLKAVFPDAGAAALLKNQWPDATFKFSSLNDRKPIADDDEVIVLLCPDYQMVREVRDMGSRLLQEEIPRPMILWNPALSSGDVGIGLNVRRMRDEFLRTFVIAYSLRPLPSGGTVFKRFPGLFKVFLEDPDTPGRYKLVAETDFRPSGDALDDIISAGLRGTETEPTATESALGVFASLQKFMRLLSR